MVNSNSCTATFTQHAAIAAIQGPQNAVDEMRAEFHTRRDLLIGGLSAIERLRCRKPLGAFYAFPNISEVTSDDAAFARRLLDETGVATLWGSSFGEHGTGFLRLSYATSAEQLTEAVSRIAGFVADYPRGDGRYLDSATRKESQWHSDRRA